MNGKEIRINRLLKDSRMLCVPLDHGITNKDIGHLAQFKKIVEEIVDGNASAIIVHKGLIRFLPNLKETGLIIHLSASTEMYKPVKKEIVCEVTEAIALGADAVSIHINLGNQYEKEMMVDFARISKDCNTYGIPLIAMMYIRDDNNKDVGDLEKIKHSIRVASELGADIVKIGANWNEEELKMIMKDALIPVVVAGGEVIDFEEICQLTTRILKSGILGVSFGRNIFMAENPKKILNRLSKIVYFQQE